MPSPSPEVRAKIAESLRRYYANSPTAQAKLRETSRKGGKATTTKKVEAEAELTTTRIALMRANQALSEANQALTEANHALSAAQAELARLRGERS